MINTEGLNFNNSAVARGVDFYDNYKFDISASISKIEKMSTLDVSLTAYQPISQHMRTEVILLRKQSIKRTQQ